MYHKPMTRPGTDATLLKEARLRATPQRLAVLAALRSHPLPLSVEEVVVAGKRRFDTTTAYRALEALLRAGIVRKVALDQGRATFEMAEGHHHHAICTSCGSVRDIALCIPSSLDVAVGKAARFARIARHSLEFFGTCQPCARSSAKKPR